MIHPVSTSVPSEVRYRRRNGLAGMGWMANQPSESTPTVAAAPSRVWISIVPSPAGTTWPCSDYPLTSSSMIRCAEVKVRARIDAVSARTLETRSRVES